MHTFPWKTEIVGTGADRQIKVIVTTLGGEKGMIFPSIKTIGNWSDLENFEANYPNVPLVQEALPFLSEGEREFLISGTTPEEWDEMFGDEE